MIHINNIELIRSYIQTISNDHGLDVQYKIKVIKGNKFRFSYSKPVEGRGSTPVRDTISGLAYDVGCYLEFLNRKFIYAYISTRAEKDIESMRNIMPEFEIIYRHEGLGYSNCYIIKSKTFMTTAYNYYDFPKIFDLPDLKYEKGEYVPSINEYFVTRSVASDLDKLFEQITFHSGGEFLRCNKKSIIRNIKIQSLLRD